MANVATMCNSEHYDFFKKFVTETAGQFNEIYEKINNSCSELLDGYLRDDGSVGVESSFKTCASFVEEAFKSFKLGMNGFNDKCKRLYTAKGIEPTESYRSFAAAVDSLSIPKWSAVNLVQSDEKVFDKSNMVDAITRFKKIREDMQEVINSVNAQSKKVQDFNPQPPTVDAFEPVVKGVKDVFSAAVEVMQKDSKTIEELAQDLKLINTKFADGVGESVGAGVAAASTNATEAKKDIDAEVSAKI